MECSPCDLHSDLETRILEWLVTLNPHFCDDLFPTNLLGLFFIGIYAGSERSEDGAGVYTQWVRTKLALSVLV